MRRIATTLMATCLLFFVACSDEGDVVTFNITFRVTDPKTQIILSV